MIRTRAVLAVALLHLLLSAGLFMASFSIGLQRSYERDLGISQPSWVLVGDRLVHTSADVLLSPLAYCAFVLGDCWVLDSLFPGPLSSFLIPLNSLLWGYGLWAIYSKIKDRLGDAR